MHASMHAIGAYFGSLKFAREEHLAAFQFVTGFVRSKRVPSRSQTAVVGVVMHKPTDQWSGNVVALWWWWWCLPLIPSSTESQKQCDILQHQPNTNMKSGR